MIEELPQPHPHPQLRPHPRARMARDENVRQGDLRVRSAKRRVTPETYAGREKTHHTAWIVDSMVTSRVGSVGLHARQDIRPGITLGGEEGHSGASVAGIRGIGG